jgi:hypothetical protein
VHNIFIIILIYGDFCKPDLKILDALEIIRFFLLFFKLFGFGHLLCLYAPAIIYWNKLCTVLRCLLSGVNLLHFTPSEK